ncbi:hypothetical protein PGS62_05335 [Yersinia rochesterensis]|uniref:hypothetical protein n=1 Tax=Yersinia TaxID=629 RepID=UPI0005E46FD8|nr:MULTISPECIES: hypothetical protein [Yersinia]MDA5543368.1 hypothetical protein [Yersinia rochesterensis]QKJ16200.1 hypothetical protein HRD70_14020 [Yersinia kristensenii]UZM73601.1 hypothetical protein OP863_11460 [Yersinia sp. SCPM-O-B-9106 (C-191)]CFR12547.1 Uncharacterised protein [Yersinia kristensenii]
MSSDNSLSYIRALVDVVAITVLSGSDEQHKLRIKQSLDAIMNHPTLEISPEGQELFAHFAALLDGSSNEVFLSARLSQDAPDPEKSHSAPHLRLLSGGKEE